MKKTWLVFRNELITIFSRRSFLFALFGIPFIGAAIFAIAGQLSKGNPAQNILSQVFSSPQVVQAEGYVDQSGIIKNNPPDWPDNTLLRFPDEAQASQALKQGDISAYYIIPANYLDTGAITYVSVDFNPLGGTKQDYWLKYILSFNLLGEDAQLASRVNTPAVINQHPLSAVPQRAESNMLTFFLPYAVTMLFYLIILSAASLLLSSVAKEKENRMMEILLVSVTPRQLLTGKIVALGLVGLLQTIVWVGTGRVLLALSGTTFNLPIAFQLPPSFLVWALIFFLLGYAVYASLMAGLGALVPNLREATQATILVIFPLIIPIFLISVLIQDPNGTLAVALSLFPLTSPITMMMRLSAGVVPFWQTLLSAVLLAITAVLVVRSVARMFRAQTILSGQPFSRKLFFSALFGRA